MSHPFAPAEELEQDFDWERAEDDLASRSYARVPYIPRRWLWRGYIPIGTPVLFAAAGGTGKGMLLALVAAYTVLGLPFPGEDPDTRREPGRVVWITGPGEDDLYEDMAPRLRAAIAHAVELFGLDPELAGEGPRGAIKLVHALPEWRDFTPVTLPADCNRVRAELAAINAKAEKHGGPKVALVVADSLSALLSDGYTIQSRQGATRVMNMLSRFARKADVAFAIVHHLTADGKVAGSPAVLNALRLAFRIGRDKEQPEFRVITEEKANGSAADPQRFAIAGDEPHTHAEFTDAQAIRDQRVREAAERAGWPGDAPPQASEPAAPAEPEPGAFWAPDAAAQQASEPAAPVPAEPQHAPDTERGPFRVLRREQPPGGPVGQLERVPGVFPTRAAARDAAATDAGTDLAWHAAGSMAGSELTSVKRADGTGVSYLVGPAG